MNADNDNRSNVTNGIPAQRDFNVTHLNSDDNDMLTATVTANNIAGGGTWTMTLTQNGKGQASLWQDPKKDNAFTGPPAGATSATFYIEGTHESGAAGDVTLKFKYTLNGNSYTSPTLAITVTPLITSFTVTPGADAGDPNKQNIIFTDQVNKNGDQGLTAETPNLAAGASYKSVATQSGLTGAYKFIQNFLGVTDGYNGTKNAAGTAVGWLNQDKSGDVSQLKNGGYPILDVGPNAKDQSYNVDFKSTPSADKSTVTITADDFPTTGVPDINGVNMGPTGIAVDLLYQLRTYVVWQWNQVAGNSGGNPVPVFYSLGYINWQVNFYATSPNGTAPITKIQILTGVTADANYTASNADPGVNALDLNRIFNSETEWVAA